MCGSTYVDNPDLFGMFSMFEQMLNDPTSEKASLGLFLSKVATVTTKTYPADNNILSPRLLLPPGHLLR